MQAQTFILQAAGDQKCTNPGNGMMNMDAIRPHYSKEEFARRGNAIYERDIRPLVEPKHNGMFIVIDIETGAYEVDANELAASDRLLQRIPTAQVWLRRVGSGHARRFGPRGAEENR
jgi:hypothetical protein